MDGRLLYLFTACIILQYGFAQTIPQDKKAVNTSKETRAGNNIKANITQPVPNNSTLKVNAENRKDVAAGKDFKTNNNTVINENLRNKNATKEDKLSKRKNGTSLKDRSIEHHRKLLRQVSNIKQKVNADGSVTQENVIQTVITEVTTSTQNDFIIFLNRLIVEIYETYKLIVTGELTKDLRMSKMKYIAHFLKSLIEQKNVKEGHKKYLIKYAAAIKQSETMCEDILLRVLLDLARKLTDIQLSYKFKGGICVNTFFEEANLPKYKSTTNKEFIKSIKNIMKIFLKEKFDKKISKNIAETVKHKNPAANHLDPWKIKFFELLVIILADLDYRVRFLTTLSRESEEMVEQRRHKQIEIIIQTIQKEYGGSYSKKQMFYKILLEYVRQKYGVLNVKTGIVKEVVDQMTIDDNFKISVVDVEKRVTAYEKAIDELNQKQKKYGFTDEMIISLLDSYEVDSKEPKTAETVQDILIKVIKKILVIKDIRTISEKTEHGSLKTINKETVLEIIKQYLKLNGYEALETAEITELDKLVDSTNQNYDGIIDKNRYFNVIETLIAEFIVERGKVPKLWNEKSEQIKKMINRKSFNDQTKMDMKLKLVESVLKNECNLEKQLSSEGKERIFIRVIDTVKTRHPTMSCKDQLKLIIVEMLQIVRKKYTSVGELKALQKLIDAQKNPNDCNCMATNAANIFIQFLDQDARQNALYREDNEQMLYCRNIKYLIKRNLAKTTLLNCKTRKAVWKRTVLNILNRKKTLMNVQKIIKEKEIDLSTYNEKQIRLVLDAYTNKYQLKSPIKLQDTIQVVNCVHNITCILNNKRRLEQTVLNGLEAMYQLEKVDAKVETTIDKSIASFYDDGDVRVKYRMIKAILEDVGYKIIDDCECKCSKRNTFFANLIRSNKNLQSFALYYFSKLYQKDFATKTIHKKTNENIFLYKTFEMEYQNNKRSLENMYTILANRLNIYSKLLNYLSILNQNSTHLLFSVRKTFDKELSTLAENKLLTTNDRNRFLYIVGMKKPNKMLSVRVDTYEERKYKCQLNCPVPFQIFEDSQKYLSTDNETQPELILTIEIEFITTDQQLVKIVIKIYQYVPSQKLNLKCDRNGVNFEMSLESQLVAAKAGTAGAPNEKTEQEKERKIDVLKMEIDGVSVQGAVCSIYK